MSLGSFDMTMHRCQRCSQPWSTNTIQSSFTARICPDCIPEVLPFTLAWEMVR